MPKRERLHTQDAVSDALEDFFRSILTHTDSPDMDACPKRAFKLRQQWLRSSGIEREAYFLQMNAEMNGLRRMHRFHEFESLLHKANAAAGIETRDISKRKTEQK